VALLYKTPIVRDVIMAHRWCKGLNQSLSEYYPNGIPAMVATGLVEIECGFNLAERERLDELEDERKRRER
jgi:hypothetical protein